MDANLIVRSGATDLTEDTTIADIPVTPQIKPIYLIVNVPEVSTDDTLVVRVNFLNASNAVLQVTETPAIAAAGLYCLALFCDHPDLSDLSVVFDVTAVADPDFGAVKAWFSVARYS